MWDENKYIQEIKYYVSPGEFDWHLAATAIIANIENDYEAQAEAGTIVMGSTLGVNDFILQSPPKPFNCENISSFKIKNNSLPIPESCSAILPFDSANIASSFVLDKNFQYPIPMQTMLIPNFDYNGISSIFKWTEDYDFCYPSYALPKSFNYEGIHAPMTQTTLFHNLPTPQIKKFKLYEDLPDWKRLNPEYIGYTKVETEVNFPNSKTATVTFEVKDRDINREEYSQFVKDYWESQS